MNKKDNKSDKRTGVKISYLALGAGLGLLLGVVIENIGGGMVIGAAVGATIDIVVARKNKK